MMTYILHNNYILVQCIIIMTTFFLYLCGRHGSSSSRRWRQWSMSCMMTYILHKNYKYTRAVYYYYDHFLPLSVRETRQQRHCSRSPKYVPSPAQILVIHTLQLLEFFITICDRVRENRAFGHRASNYVQTVDLQAIQKPREEKLLAQAY